MAVARDKNALCVSLALYGLGCSGGSRLHASALALDAATSVKDAEASCENAGCAVVPTVLASGQSSPGPIVVDDTNVYWANLSPNAILMCSKRGCGDAPTVLAQGDWGVVERIVIQGDSIYWAGSRDVYRCSTHGCGGTPTSLKSDGITVLDMAVDAMGDVDLVEFGAFGSYFIECPGFHCNPYANLSPLQPDAGFAPDGGAGGWPLSMGSVVADRQSVYVLASALPDGGTSTSSQDNDTVILSCSPGACATTVRVVSVTFAQNVGFSAGPSFIVDDGGLYFLTAPPDRSSVTVQRFPKPPAGAAGQGSTAPSPVTEGLTFLAGMASDGTNLYFTERGDTNVVSVSPFSSSVQFVPNSGRISRCAVAGCGGAPQVFLAYVDGPGGIAVDDSAIYWTEVATGDASTSAGRVMMLPK